MVNGRSNIPYSKKREYWKSKELQACDPFAYNIQTHDIYYKQAYAQIYGWWKFDAKRAERVQQRIKRCKDQLLISKAILQECKLRGKNVYGMDCLSESFRQGATQLDN